MSKFNLAACCMQIDPQELRDRTIIFEDKSKFRIKDERYCITTHSTNHNVTCVFNTKKDTPQYKTGKNFSFIRKLEEKFCTFLLHYPLLCICINADIFCIVNVKPVGFLTVRRKLSGAPEVKPISTENSGVQFPDNLRTRHPLFGVIRERKRRSKKHNSYKES